MNFEKELRKKGTNIRSCSVQSGIPYATLYPIITGQVDIGTCSYHTVAKLAKFLGYRPDEIVYDAEDFQTFRNNLHHRINRGELPFLLETIEGDDVSYYVRHEDYLKALYLVAAVDYLSKKNQVPLCNKYDDIRHMRLSQPYYVGDSAFMPNSRETCIPEFVNYNIYEGDLYDAV
jgi:lambda repressor-like predicted transcriptional regulator